MAEGREREVGQENPFRHPLDVTLCNGRSLVVQSYTGHVPLVRANRGHLPPKAERVLFLPS